MNVWAVLVFSLPPRALNEDWNVCRVSQGCGVNDVFIRSPLNFSKGQMDTEVLHTAGGVTSASCFQTPLTTSREAREAVLGKNPCEGGKHPPRDAEVSVEKQKNLRLYQLTWQSENESDWPFFHLTDIIFPSFSLKGPLNKNCHESWVSLWLLGFVLDAGTTNAKIHADVPCYFYILFTDRRNKVLPDSATCWLLKLGSSHPIGKKQGIIKKFGEKSDGYFFISLVYTHIYLYMNSYVLTHRHTHTQSIFSLN